MKFVSIYKSAILTITVLTAITSSAAINRKAALTEKKNNYLTNGVFIGGEGGQGFSLVDVRRHYSVKDQIERVVLELGDERGMPTPKIGYFQVSVHKELKRVDIDLSQMRGAKVDQKKLQSLFEKSPLVKSAKINYDPEDQGVIIQLQLATIANVEVFRVPAKDKSGRIVVDIKKL